MLYSFLFFVSDWMTRSVYFSFCSALFHLLEVTNLDVVTTLSVSRVDRVARDTQGVEGLCLSSCFKIIVIHHHFFLFVDGRRMECVYW